MEMKKYIETRWLGNLETSLLFSMCILSFQPYTIILKNVIKTTDLICAEFGLRHYKKMRYYYINDESNIWFGPPIKVMCCFIDFLRTSC